MKKKRLLSLIMALCLMFGSAAALPEGLFADSTSIEASASTDVSTVSDTNSHSSAEKTEGSVQHAYDPMAELKAKEAEEELRKTVEIVDKTVLFTINEKRSADAKAEYLTDESPICKEYGLKKVEMILETKTENEQGTYEVFYQASASVSDIWELVDKLNADERISNAEPDYVWKDSAVGGYAEVSGEEFAKETHFPCLDVENVWSGLHNDGIKAPGYGTVVAVIDTGVDYTHKDLKDSMWVNAGEIPGNGIDDDNNGYVDDVHGYDFVENDGDPMDDHGHGTHVSGIIAMSPSNGGGVGLAYGAKIMAVRAGQATGSFASTDIAKAIKYAADNGADVINMSFGGTGKSYLVEQALKDANSTCVLVAAAGNDGLPTTDGPAPSEDIYPAGYNYVLGVMATDINGSLATFSNWDFFIGANCEYEMAAPGVAIYSTLPGNRYAAWSGTSMSAPTVAASAAIIRSMYTDKSKYTSKYIMGQLVSATQSKSSGREYPLLNIKDSLTKQPKPKVKLNEFYIFDNPSISSSNNGDGIAQPGEVIDIGISAFNYWGIAKDVTVSIDTLSVGGVANPHAEIITGSVNIGEIGTFATGNNGFTYTDGKLTSVSKPLRIKIKEGTANDIQIPINITISAKNGMDDKDKNTYTSKTSKTIIVQNGYAISGVIDHDMTLTADKYWIIQNNILIPEGVTVTVEPGTQIQFWSAASTNPYGKNQDVYIQVEGRFVAEGTEDNPIEMFPGKGFENKAVNIGGNTLIDYSDSIIDADYSKAYTFLKYVNIINGSSKKSYPDSDWTYRKAFCSTVIDHCHFIINNLNNLDSLHQIYARVISDTIFENYIDDVGNDCSKIISFDINKCIFIKSNTRIRGTLPDIFNINFCNNVILQCDNDFSECNMYNIGNELLYNNYISDLYGLNYNEYKRPNGEPNFSNNAILSQLWTVPHENLKLIRSAAGHNTYDISGNYWGTTDPELVKVQCYDADANTSLDQLVQEPYLTLEDDMSAIYPFMTEAYLTDMDGTRIDKVVGNQKVKMHVKFNRDMAQDVQPMVTYGGSEPYTDYSLTGSWVSAREWISEFTLDPYINVGKMYIRSKGAVAADDRWLVTGEDSARFFFEVTSTSAQSMSLQGEGQLGQNALTWMQDDYDTLAGYNIYRSTSYDPTRDAKEQGFTKVNNSLITEEELSFTDKNVDPNYDYYYYFTVADTDMNESKASNVVKCRPLEDEKPVITHTPVTALRPETAITITADITDNVAVTGAELHYKNKLASEWKTAAMRNISGSTYKATISAYEVEDEDIEYYITATDGTNIGTCGTADKPMTIEAYYVKSVSIVKMPDKLEYDIGHPLDLTGMVVTAVYNNDDVVKVTDYEVSDFDNMSEGEKTLTISYGGVEAELKLTVTVNHIHRYDSTKTEATCTKEGKWTYVCSICGHTYEEGIEKKPHEYEEMLTKPTCTEKGYTTHKCKNCDDSYVDSYTPANGHSYTSAITKAANCEKDGVRTYTCETCGDTYTEVITAKGHKYTSKVTKEPGCIEDGVRTYTCEYCGDTYVETIPATKHEYTTKVVKPTCTAQGYTLHTCTKCGDSYKDTYTEITSHSFGDWVTTKEATCTTDGSQSRKCENCDETETRKIAALGHDYKETVVAPTCTEKGYTRHKCSRCNDFYKDTYTDAAGHDLGDWEVITKPTCTTRGEETRKCKNCDKTENRDVDALGHDYVETVVASTCTTKGYTNHKCSRCKDEYNDTETPMIAHKFGEWRVTTEPTCTDKGVETRNCSICNKAETRQIDSLGGKHDYVETVVAPTCTEQGYTLHKCSRCDDSYKDTYINATGHSFGEWTTTKEPTTTSTGVKTRKCSVCGKEETEEIPMIEESVIRYAGKSRYDTAALISNGAFTQSDYVVLAYSNNYADALAGVPLAKAYNAPILLTSKDSLSQETLTEIKRLKAKTAIILGGKGAISAKVEQELVQNGLKTERIAGSSRFETATKIAEALQKKTGKQPTEVFFVYAFGFADALSVSTVAAIKGAPILYVSTNGSIDKATADYLAKQKGKIKNAYVIGGKGVISDEVRSNTATALGLKSTARVAGANRYDTCVAVNTTFKDVLTGTAICVATGANFPDALAGGVFAATKNAPLFLAAGGLNETQTKYLKEKKAQQIFVFGGTGAVPNDLVERIAKAS